MKVLGVVGIRSGSKGVPDKNVRPLAGKPLVGWVLEAAAASKHIDRIMVSTDSEKYAAIARTFGAEVPYLRPSALAQDMSPEYEYVKHLLEWLEANESYRPDIVVRMMATVPLQTTEDLDGVIETLINDAEADAAVVVAEARQHPMKALKVLDDGNGRRRLVTYFSESGREITPIARQNYPKAYFRANVIACRTRVIFETNSLTGDTVRPYVIPQERAIDIDSPTDFYLIERLMERARRDTRP
jgi:CMP-N,N'-diacetyllegionaminic acid synthase